MSNLIEDFLERNHEFFRSVENKLTVCVRPEGIIDREPDEMWQGFLKNMPEELYRLDVVIFDLDKDKMRLILEVPGDELKAALEKLHKFGRFYMRVEVEENEPVDNIAAWMTVQDAMLTEINLIKHFKEDVFVGFIVRILPDRLIIYNPGAEARDMVHLFLDWKHTWEYIGAGLITVDSKILRFAHERKNRRVYLRLQEVKYINPDEEFVPQSIM